MSTLKRKSEDFYRQQYDELNKRFLRLQEEQLRAQRQVKYSRMLAMLIHEAYHIANSDISMDQICQQFLQVVLETLNADCATILVYLSEQKCFVAQYSLGFPKDMLSGFTIGDLPGEYYYVNSDSVRDPVIDSLRQAAGVPCLVWTFNPRAGVALLIGNSKEDQHFYNPFEESDRELIEDALNIFVDIIERRQREEELKQAKESAEKARQAAETANRTKTEFLANMSHELRTPLNHIIGFTELVVDKHFGDLNATQKEYLNDVLHSSKHLLSLINDILDLSKVEAGKLEIRPTKIYLKMLLGNSLIMIKEKAMKYGIQLTTDFQEIPETIIADERKLKQILYNLLANAVKFTPDGGSICLSARRIIRIPQPTTRYSLPMTQHSQLAPENFIKISVSDTGIGLKGDDLVRIFEPFEQVGHSVTRGSRGTGLGLSLTKKLVELHGGRIWAESEGQGKGSTFTFILPILPGTKDSEENN